MKFVSIPSPTIYSCSNQPLKVCTISALVIPLPVTLYSKLHVYIG